MILVLLGTFDIDFSRPLRILDELCRAGVLTEEIIVQSGHTKFDSPYFNTTPFINRSELDRLYQEARVIICHAGTGSILKGVKLGKKVIAIARLERYGECVDDHQLEILNEFVKLGYIIPWNEGDSLEDILLNLDGFSLNDYVSNKRHVIRYLEEYINSL